MAAVVDAAAGGVLEPEAPCGTKGKGELPPELQAATSNATAASPATDARECPISRSSCPE
jgi:hypothetical protein